MEQKQLLKVRGVLRHEDSILLCYNKAQHFYFLPGGSLELGENLPQCLIRELQEECGLQLSVGRFLGCLECHWQAGMTQYQEVNFVFQLYTQQIPIPRILQSLEDHISFFFLKEADVRLGKYRLLPEHLVQFLDAPTTPQYLFERQYSL